jgi:hypothetical protein
MLRKALAKSVFLYCTANGVGADARITASALSSASFKGKEIFMKRIAASYFRRVNVSFV